MSEHLLHQDYQLKKFSHSKHTEKTMNKMQGYKCKRQEIKKGRDKLSSHCWRPLRNRSRALERANLNLTANTLDGKKETGEFGIFEWGVRAV